MRGMGLHAQKRGWARDVTWIAGHRQWSRYRESPRRRDVRDGGCAGLPRRDLQAVGVPVLCREFCAIKKGLRANLKLCRVIPQQINKPVTYWLLVCNSR